MISVLSNRRFAIAAVLVAFVASTSEEAKALGRRRRCQPASCCSYVQPTCGQSVASGYEVPQTGAADEKSGIRRLGPQRAELLPTIKFTSCKNDGKCWINVEATIQKDPIADVPEWAIVRVEPIASSTGCNTPVFDASGNPIAGFETIVPTDIGSNNFKVEFGRTTATTHPRLVTCSATYKVTIWVKYANGSRVCYQRNVVPNTLCTEATGMPCQDCEIVMP